MHSMMKLSAAVRRGLPKSTLALAIALAAVFGAPKAEAQTTTTCAPLTQGFWKNHPTAWGKVTTLTLGTVTYTKTQLETILEDPMQSDQMKADVSRDLESIYAFEKQNRHRTTDMAQKAVRSVRMAIKRLHQRLSVATDQRGKPHPVLVPFAGHLHKYLIVPSARYCSPRGLLARAGLAGCFTYEPPENVVWVG